MTQLEAVNLILRALSEHTVSSVEIRHPSVTLALDWMDIAREELNGGEWWYNKYRITLPVQNDGRVQVPANTLSFVPDSFEGVLIDGYLYNQSTQSYQFTSDVSGVLVVNSGFDNLPPAAQRVVAFKAALYAYDNDVGDNPPQRYERGFAEALESLSAAHSRQRRFNARSRRAWQRYENARRG